MVDLTTLFQIRNSHLYQLMLECELALACIKDDNRGLLHLHRRIYGSSSSLIMKY